MVCLKSTDDKIGKIIYATKLSIRCVKDQNYMCKLGAPRDFVNVKCKSI